MDGRFLVKAFDSDIVLKAGAQGAPFVEHADKQKGQQHAKVCKNVRSPATHRANHFSA